MKQLSKLFSLGGLILIVAGMFVPVFGQESVIRGKTYSVIPDFFTMITYSKHGVSTVSEDTLYFVVIGAAILIVLNLMAFLNGGKVKWVTAAAMLLYFFITYAMYQELVGGRRYDLGLLPGVYFPLSGALANFLSAGLSLQFKRAQNAVGASVDVSVEEVSKPKSQGSFLRKTKNLSFAGIALLVIAAFVPIMAGENGSGWGILSNIVPFLADEMRGNGGYNFEQGELYLIVIPLAVVLLLNCYTYARNKRHMLTGVISAIYCFVVYTIVSDMTYYNPGLAVLLILLAAISNITAGIIERKNIDYIVFKRK